ncbi:MAG: hypothetical protein M1827_002259 [Pycnora praestabilis]|nr:MAG: hypothetical protein M1827_002259 [Pycnora praestabilis]
MVFKPFTHLARQNFAKSFTHGYAQSVVAASQSSYASSNTNFGPFGHHSASRFGKAGASQLKNAFQISSSPSSTAARAGQASSNGNGDGGLSDYYAAWQQQQHGEEEKEWKQFQFTKRIGWQGPSGVKEDKAVESLRSEPSRLRSGTLERSYSTSAVDDIKVAEVRAAAVVEAVIAEEHGATQDEAMARNKVVSNHQATYEQAPTPPVAPFQSPALSTESTGVKTPVSSGTTSASSVSESQSQAYTDHIESLQATHSYDQIPAVFESMLIGGIEPTTASYNALLAAAIHLPTAKHRVVPKALDVYSDMLRRKVLPNTATYSTLIELLAGRALDVGAMKQSMEQNRLRFGGMEEPGRFMFRSDEAEFDILAEDDSLNMVVKLFTASTSVRHDRTFSAETYRLIITACAEQGRVEDMIRIYSHMETGKVVPSSAMFIPMIHAFATSGDLVSAVECYNEYKILAIANDDGKFTLVDRMDNDVYAAVIKAYAVSGKSEGGVKFLGKIYDSYDDVTENRGQRLAALEDTVIAKAFVQERLDSGFYTEALKWVEERQLSSTAQDEAMRTICFTAADNNDMEVATKAFQTLLLSNAQSSAQTIAMLALHIRRGEVQTAKVYWDILSSVHPITSDLVAPTSMYAVALIGSGLTGEGLMQARQMYARIRNSTQNPKAVMNITEEIDEGIEFIGRFLTNKSITPSFVGTNHLLWTMIENGGLITPVAEQLLAGLVSEDIEQLGWKDLTMILEVQAGIIVNGSAMSQVANTAQFTQLFEALLASGTPIGKRTSHLIEQTISKLGKENQNLASQWHNYMLPALAPVYPPVRYAAQSQQASSVAPSAYQDTFDPYASSTDFKGSVLIADELEKSNVRVGSHLSSALMTFKNMRRAGRHPRYITYAKLISAAAKEDRTDVVQDILGMAKQDVPFLPQHRVVKYGWISILDSVIGAHLTLGDRASAARYHQELLDLGAAPTANTFGLYITTLKESTKTFDEATEAVKIFHRAKSEGVEPSSFLYNALIGKLGRARRIDDCLFYFAEMRSLGIRPTSVTYGTVVNALCRVSDEKFAEEMFDEMETTPNYKPRPAPYNSMMQFFLTTKRDRSKVLAYYERMKSKNIQPTMHTYKLLIDTYATLEPIDMAAAEEVLQSIRRSGQRPEAVHYASLIHAKGCVLHDIDGARKIFDIVIADSGVRPQACLYQALFEALVANHHVADTETILKDMSARRVEMTPYIANTLIHGWAAEKNINKSKGIYDTVGICKREPSTYEAMTRAFLAVEDRDSATKVVQEMLARGYPSAVSGKILDLVGGGNTYSLSAIASEVNV